MLVASAVLALLIAAVFVAQLLAVRDLSATSDNSRRAARVAAVANDLERDVIDLETGVRGYVISGKERFLEPWHAARRRLPGELSELRRFLSDPREKEQEAGLDLAIRSYIAQWSLPVLATARKDLAAAQTLVSAGGGKRRVDAIRDRFNRFRTADQSAATMRVAKADAASRLAFRLAIGGLVGSFLLILLFAGYLSRAIVAPVRRMTRATARLAAGDLAVRVPDGAGEIGELARGLNFMAESLGTSRDELHAEKERAEGLSVINRAVLDATPDGISMFDAEGNTLLRNEASKRLLDELGLRSDGSLREGIAGAAEQTPDSDRFLREMQALAADPERESRHEYELAGRNAQIYSAPVKNASGSFSGRIFVVHDVTRERQAERLKEDLVATVSHELRTPLTGILGYAELLSSREYDAETRRRYLGMIHSQAKRLTTLITDFLDLQRIEEGSFTLALEPFDLGELVREEIELYAGQSQAHRLELAGADGPVVVMGERDRIAQVTANLLSNAIKYSPQGGTVQVRIEPHDGVVRVAVSDEGIGIPPDQHSRMFEKFFRVDTTDTREIGGTGLGLALSREIVEAHGGHIGFESSEGEGSTFWFELPGERPRDEATKEAYALVVENDSGPAGFIADCLHQEGYATEIVRSGEEALERARKDKVVLICLDTVLANELDGWQVLAELKGSPATAHIPVVVCSGSPGSSPDRAAAIGAADFLQKPFSAEQLVSAIRRIVPTGRASVLVVDDEAAVRTLVRETLEGEGFDLREAADGEEALAAIAKQKPDAIILDLLMPGLDGFAVIDHLQGGAETRSIPILVLTGRSLSTEERRLLETQTVALLSKQSYSAAELRRLIRQAAGQKRL
jgi:signal transduction histidine kinase/DNA-binding response OmpR family regulator/CHASE3 domain sensor protein